MRREEFHTALRIGLRLATLGVLCAVAGYAPLALHARTLPTAPWDTDARLPGMPSGAAHAALVLGSSRAYLFSRFSEHHPMLEAALGGPVYNVAMPTGGGLRPGRLYFDEYLARGNQPAVVIYCLDPFVFYGVGANDAHKFVYFEPLELRFLARLIGHGYPPRQIFTYARSKWSRDWWERGPEPLVRHDGTVRPEDVHPDRIAARFDSLYQDGRNEENFARFAPHLAHIAEVCAARGIPLRLVFLPTLLGHEPGMARVQEWLAAQQTALDFEVADWTNAMPDPALYYNLDHLNTAGVATFLHDHLAPGSKNCQVASPPHGRVAVPGDRAAAAVAVSGSACTHSAQPLHYASGIAIKRERAPCPKS